jgi:hypothetical protein
MANHGQEGGKAFTGVFTKEFVHVGLNNGSPLRGLHENSLYKKKTFEESLQRKAHVSPGQKKAKSSGNACLLSSREASLGPSRWD